MACNLTATNHKIEVVTAGAGRSPPTSSPSKVSTRPRRRSRRACSAMTAITSGTTDVVDAPVSARSAALKFCRSGTSTRPTP